MSTSQQKLQWRKSNPEKWKAQRTRERANRREKLKRMRTEGDHLEHTRRTWSARAGKRRYAGKDFTIKFSDLDWPVCCPVLGVPLDYSEKAGPNHWSLDRFDPSKGYIPGNVYVISHRANSIKSNATAEELEKVLNWIKSEESRLTAFAHKQVQ